MEKGKRFLLDISSVKGRSYGGSKFWILIVDEAKDMKWSFFVKKKNELAEKVFGLIKQLRMQYECRVQIIRMDNAGENQMLKEQCTKKV